MLAGISKPVNDITTKHNKEIVTLIIDGSYGNYKNFQLLSFKGIKPDTKIRKNSKCRKQIILLATMVYKYRKIIYHNRKISYTMFRDG